jgi:RimJ/RimL family protein N-acetyltransferase
MSHDGVVHFREIALADEAELLKLRNNSANLVFFKNTQEVSALDHNRWLLARLNKFKGMQIVGQFGDQLIGIVYLTPIGKRSVSVSINIDPHFQSKGVGHQLLSQIIARAEFLGFEEIEAIIHSSNEKSIALFEKCDFAFVNTISSSFCLYKKT